MNRPMLYGIGAGPGAADLLTLRAASLLRTVPVLAFPRSNDYGESMAHRIVRSHLADGSAQQRLFLTFPMSKDPARVKPAVIAAANVLSEQLVRGHDVAFVTEGDPSTFSTFGYVRAELVARMPRLEVEVVPGVSSIMAVPAVAGIPLADGHERIAILSGTSGFADLESALDRFDTVVLMKLGDCISHVVRLLEHKGLVERAVYVSRATMEDQRVERDVRRLGSGAKGDCFAMMVIAKGDRRGVLLGEVPFAGREEGEREEREEEGERGRAGTGTFTGERGSRA